MARLRFIECGPACIARGCTARCCDAPSRPDGMLVTIHPSEQTAIEARGGEVRGGLLRPAPGKRGCPFKRVDNLCSLHFTPDKPFGCIASPFTLNSRDTLIVRNRYKMLPCYAPDDGEPAYRVFNSSLVLIFGPDEAGRICRYLDAGGGDIDALMPAVSYRRLKDNDAIKKRA